MKRHELDALEHRVLVGRRDREADVPRGFRQDVRRRRQQVVNHRRIAGFLAQPRFDPAGVPRRPAALQEQIDVEAVAEIGRNPARGGVRLPDVPHVLELGQHVPDRSRGHVEPGPVHQGGRCHGLARFDVITHQRGEDAAGAVGQDHGAH